VVTRKYLDFVVKSGRAVAFPVYKGSYERGNSTNTPLTPRLRRDLIIQNSKDLGRTIDYLETRKEFDKDKFGYYGVSWGGDKGTILVAVEDRIKLAILISGSLSTRKELPPEINQINFLPHIKVPLLMINGRHDHWAPVETNQNPMFRLLGTPDINKRHIVIDGGHRLPKSAIIKEILDWLDRYLGPVS